MRNLMKLWVFLPLAGGIYPVLAGTSQQTGNISNQETFNQVFYIVTSGILVIILSWAQRAVARTTQKVATVEAQSVPQKDHDSLKKVVEELKTGLAVTAIQEQLVKVLDHLASNNEATIALLAASKSGQDTLSEMVRTGAGKLDSVKDDTGVLRQWSAEVNAALAALKTLLENPPDAPQVLTALGGTQRRVDDLHEKVDRLLEKVRTQPLPKLEIAGQPTPEQSN